MFVYKLYPEVKFIQVIYTIQKSISGSQRTWQDNKEWLPCYKLLQTEASGYRAIFIRV